jgi:hypothetical protein
MAMVKATNGGLFLLSLFLAHHLIHHLPIVMLLRWPRRWWIFFSFFVWQLVHHLPNYHVVKMTKKMMIFFSFFMQHLVHHLPNCHLVHQLLVYHLTHHVLWFPNRKVFFFHFLFVTLFIVVYSLYSWSSIFLVITTTWGPKRRWTFSFHFLFIALLVVFLFITIFIIFLHVSLFTVFFGHCSCDD